MGMSYKQAKSGQQRPVLVDLVVILLISYGVTSGLNRDTNTEKRFTSLATNSDRSFPRLCYWCRIFVFPWVFLVLFRL